MLARFGVHICLFAALAQLKTPKARDGNLFAPAQRLKNEFLRRLRTRAASLSGRPVRAAAAAISWLFVIRGAPFLRAASFHGHFAAARLHQGSLPPAHTGHSSGAQLGRSS